MDLVGQDISGFQLDTASLSPRIAGDDHLPALWRTVELGQWEDDGEKKKRLRSELLDVTGWTLCLLALGTDQSIISVRTVSLQDRRRGVRAGMVIIRASDGDSGDIQAPFQKWHFDSSRLDASYFLTAL